MVSTNFQLALLASVLKHISVQNQSVLLTVAMDQVFRYAIVDHETMISVRRTEFLREVIVIHSHLHLVNY